jgi:ABC-2 type transport system ATP-binding protein
VGGDKSVSEAMTDAASVRVKDLSKIYHPSPGWMKFLVRTNIKQDVVALDGVSFDVGPGEICAVVGPNGAGKTTTFRILIGLTTSSSGEARVMGHDCNRESVSVRRIVGWMPAEDRSLVMRLSCSENLYFHGQLQGLKGEDLRERVRLALSRVGLTHAAESTVFALSAGMRARLQLGRALLHDPRVLILDEPTGSVDPVASHELLNLIIEIVESQGLAALISSHRLEEIEALHSHAILLDRGRMRFDGDLDTLRRQIDRPGIEIEFTNQDAARRAAKEIENPGLGSVQLDETRIECILTPDVTVGAVLSVLNPILDQVVHFREVQTPLRDLLAQMYQRNEAQEESDS